MNYKRNVKGDYNMKIEDIKVTKNDISYTELVDMVGFAVDNSFSASNGEYHKYLQDYAEALAILVHCTNYTIEEGITIDQLYNEVMEISNSDVWDNEIVPELGSYYEKFVEYVDSEIETRQRPFAKFDSVLINVNELASQMNMIMKSVDSNKLSNYDFSKLLDAVEHIYSGIESTNQKQNVRNEQNVDNIVEFNSEQK